MPHYHVRVGDLQGPALMRAMSGAPKLPSVKPPKAAPAKAPKAPTAKPPAAPQAGGKQSGGFHYQMPKPAPATPKSPWAAPTKAVQGVTRTIGKGTGLVRRGEEGINRLSEFGEQFSGDSGGRDEMGHYHFNIPSKGSRMSQDYGTAEGARKREQGGYQQRNSTQSHAYQYSQHKQAAQRHQQNGNNRFAQAHNEAAQAHSEAWRNPNPGNSAHAWGATTRAHQITGDKRSRDQASAGLSMASTSGGMSSTGGGMSSTSGVGMDSGTSEGAKKAAQTRRQGSNERSVRSGGNYGVDIKAGVNTRQVTKRPDPEPYRGYDSRK